ncbi:MAG: hypothetical protein K2L18_07700, partial [Acetatifactor sp.]|nr:hypothetical protein [Acetatifactor sp.]
HAGYLPQKAAYRNFVAAGCFFVYDIANDLSEARANTPLFAAGKFIGRKTTGRQGKSNGAGYSGHGAKEVFWKDKGGG